MNFIFISPHFPESYWLFAKGLKKYGVHVFAIIDTPYDSLSQELKDSIEDYIIVPDMTNYDAMLRAVAYFTWKHGKIDWIESNNEFWLRQDARLRLDFHIANGIQLEKIDEYQSKHHMKEFYKKANIPTARYAMACDLEQALAFVAIVGYPIVIKPDVGVGASDTHKIKNDRQLKAYFSNALLEPMIMEEYIKGSCFSFDGIVNSKGELLFVTSHQYTDSIMDSVNEHKTIGCYSYKDIPQDIMDAGIRVIKAFDTRSRFFHFEFFRLQSDQSNVGKKGDIIGLEVNMRPPGGFLPDMINYANDSNVFQLWADMIVTDTIEYKQIRKYSSGFIGRRDNLTYRHSPQEIKERYGKHVLMDERLPQALAEAMGNEVIVVRFETEKEMLEFFRYASALNKPKENGNA